MWQISPTCAARPAASMVRPATRTTWPETRNGVIRSRTERESARARAIGVAISGPPALPLHAPDAFQAASHSPRVQLARNNVELGLEQSVDQAGLREQQAAAGFDPGIRADLHVALARVVLGPVGAHRLDLLRVDRDADKVFRLALAGGLFQCAQHDLRVELDGAADDPLGDRHRQADDAGQLLVELLLFPAGDFV